MFQTVEIPLWALVLILAFAMVTFASHFLFPSVRWYFRRRMERVVSRLNQRLERPIQPFKLARRHDMIQRLIYDAQIAQAINDHAREQGIPENVAFEEARRYAREIVPRFSATAYFGFAIRFARWFSRTLYRVRLGYFDETALNNINPDATVVFVMNHRSNMDYVLVTYLAAERSALSYAVGEWARVWPLQGLIRAMGAYFIRRKSRNALYRRVLARYVQLATKNGVAQAMFPEGGLSLTGAVRDPKMGLLKYVIDGFDAGQDRDVVFVPVALNYDRVLEDRVLTETARAGDGRFRVHLGHMFGFVLRQIKFKLTGRFHRFGYAAVSFGAPLSLGSFPKPNAEDVAGELIDRIRQVVPVLPVPLVAHILARSDGALGRPDIETQARQIVSDLAERGIHTHIPRDSISYAVEFGLNVLTKRKLAIKEEKTFKINTLESDLVDYYAQSIAHHFADAE